MSPRLLLAWAGLAAITALAMPTGRLAAHQVQDRNPTAAEHGTGTILGLTVDAAAGWPVGGVAVELTTQSITREAISDASGRFAFRDLPRGDFFLGANLDGWIDSAVDDIRPIDDEYLSPIGRTVQLTNGQSIENMRIRLHKLPSVSGRVTDENGAPIVGATVFSMRYSSEAGRRTLHKGFVAWTNDRGGYEISSLVAGDYAVTASVDFKRLQEITATVRTRLFSFPRRYYPDATDPSAAGTLTLNWSDDRHDVDLTLRQAPAVRITGRVTGASSFRTQAYVHLEHTDPIARDLSLFVANAYLDEQGNFTMAPVPPGNYVLTTYGAQSASGRLLWTHQPIPVGTSDINDVRAPVQEALRLSGRVAFAGVRDKPTGAELERIAVCLLPPWLERMSDVIPPNRHVNADGGFTSVEMEGGRYLVWVWGLPEGWTLRSAMVNGQDAADRPVDLTSTDLDGAVLTFTDRTAGLHGRVTDRDGKAVGKALVLAYPTDESLWIDYGPARRLRLAPTTIDGSYVMPPLPAGEYYVTAVATVPASGWRDDEVLRGLARTSLRVSLAEGADRLQDLRLTARTPIRR